MRTYQQQFIRGKLTTASNPHDKGDCPNTEVAFSFNPSKVKLATSAKWDQPAQKASKGASRPDYKGPEPRTLEFEITLDEFDLGATNEGEVQQHLSTLVSFTRPTKTTRGTKKPSPPVVKLDWGKALWSFESYVKSVSATITMFSPTGLPLRATVAISLVELPGKTYPVNPTSHSRVGQQSHTMAFGESLAAVAHQYYEKPALWRGLAALNEIDDPTRLRAGRQIYLPPIEDVAAAST